MHVDAYRLGSAAELDDLDIDFPHSIVVVEWGAGMIDGLVDSRLDVTIERPALAGDDEDQPRVVRVEGFGPRWSAGLPV